jgi:hypothetical protein
MKRPAPSAALDKARAEIAAKRRKRETRFADTVLGWTSEEEAARDAFPSTVLGWDHPAAQINAVAPGDVLLAALAAEEAATAVRRRWKRFACYCLAATAAVVAGFVVAGFMLR